jgi:NAD+ kinase
MKIAIYGRVLNENAAGSIQQLFDILHQRGIATIVFEPFLALLRNRIKLQEPVAAFSEYKQVISEAQFVISIGGDGTLLDTIAFVRDSGIPVLGINTGRLGFLTGLEKSDLQQAIDDLLKNAYTLDKRSLLLLESNIPLFNGINYALNDFVIHKKETSSMITVHTFINGEFLNSYWADGLIISTPTGSTGYSLSCGGPIIFPRSASFVITPVSPHNLNVRPIIVPDDNVISFEIEGRGSTFLVSLDSRSETISSSIEMAVRKADFTINLVRLNQENYLDTLRNKLMWGLDNRN